jgi:hypothetical protein
MDRLGHISIAHHIAPIKERHHRRNLFNLTPCAHPEALNSSARRTSHPIRASRLPRKGGTDRCCPLASRERGEFAAWERSEWRARSSKSHT